VVDARDHFLLDGVVIRPDRLEIEVGGEARRLGPRAMEVLLCLADRGDEVVTKEEILQAVWGDQIVGDDVLSTAVWELRRALGDQAKSPQFIQTVPRRGYRLLVTPTPIPVQEVPAEAGSWSEPEPARGRGLWWGAVVVSAIAVAILTWGNLRRDPPPARALAVLPIEALGGVAADQALADGVTDTLITALAGIDGLRVVSRTTSLTFRNSGRTVPDIAEELGVDLVVEGTLARQDERIVLNAQLIDAHTEDHLWAKTYERRFEHLLDVQVEVARSIGGAIAHRLQPEPGVPSPTVPAAVTDALLQWRFVTSGEVWSGAELMDDVMVFASRDGRLYGADASSGVERWRVDLNQPISAPIVRLGERLVVMAEDGTVAVVDGLGNEFWRRRPLVSNGAALAVAEDLVLVGGDGGELAALDPTSGRELWTWHGGGGITGLAAGGDTVVVSRFDGAVSALRPVDGGERWTVTLSDWLRAPAVVDDGIAYVANPSGSVVALDLATGGEVWRAQVSAPHALSRWRDRLVVGSASAGMAVVLDRTTGDEVWRLETRDDILTTVAIGDLVLVGSRDRSLYVHDAWTGRRLHRIEFRTWPTSTPALHGDHLVVGTLDGRVHRLRLPEAGEVPLVLRQEDGFQARPEPVDSRDRRFETIRLAPDRLKARVAWRAEVGGGPLLAPAFTDDAVLVGSGEDLVALDLRNGSARWRRRLPGEPGTPPVISDGLAVVGARDGTVVALDAANGVERWRFVTGEDVISPPALADGVLYVGSRDGHLYALDLHDGRERWRRRVGVVHGGAAVIDDLVMVGARGDVVWGLERLGGELRWRHESPDWVVADLVFAGAALIAPSCDGTVEALDPGTGALTWQARVGGEIWYRAAAIDGVLVFGSRDGHLYGFDPATGREQWRRRTDGWVLSSVAAWRGLAAAGSHDRRLWVVDVEDGRPVWQLATTGTVGSPAVSGDLLAVGSTDGFVYLVELTDPRPGDESGAV
jgi:outer membrane protein assembly factor BamB/TolB-like protein/DNA-binding winged helix-turn-helix (wHTH) protein